MGSGVLFGDLVGNRVGRKVGSVGLLVGCRVGNLVGRCVGTAVGAIVGKNIGECVSVESPRASTSYTIYTAPAFAPLTIAPAAEIATSTKPSLSKSPTAAIS